MKVQSCNKEFIGKFKDIGKSAQQYVKNAFAESEKMQDVFISAKNMKEKINKDTILGVLLAACVGKLAWDGARSLITNIKNVKEDKELE